MSPPNPGVNPKKIQGSVGAAVTHRGGEEDRVMLASPSATPLGWVQNLRGGR